MRGRFELYANHFSKNGRRESKSKRMPAMDLDHAYARHRGWVQFVKQERDRLFGSVHMALGHFFRVTLHIQLKDIHMRRVGIHCQLIEL